MSNEVIALWPMKTVVEVTGHSKTTIWRKAKKGLFPKSIRTARNASKIPSNEVMAVNRAVIAGKSDEEIKQLVAELHAARTLENQ